MCVTGGFRVGFRHSSGSFRSAYVVHLHTCRQLALYEVMEQFLIISLFKSFDIASKVVACFFSPEILLSMLRSEDRTGASSEVQSF